MVSGISAFLSAAFMVTTQGYGRFCSLTCALCVCESASESEIKDYNQEERGAEESASDTHIILDYSSAVRSFGVASLDNLIFARAICATHAHSPSARSIRFCVIWICISSSSSSSSINTWGNRSKQENPLRCQI
jgi:hypothetical protein